jgi:hypothetical protein
MNKSSEALSPDLLRKIDSHWRAANYFEHFPEQSD